MNISKQHLKTAHATSTDDARPVLKLIRITSDKEAGTVVSVATDSFKLIQQTQKKSPEEIEESETIHMTRGDVAKQAIEYQSNKGIEPYIPVRHVTETEGKFPAYENIIPKEKPTATVSVSAEFLKELLKAFTKEKDSSNTVKIEFYGPQKPLLFKGNRADCEILALLMSVRVP